MQCIIKKTHVKETQFVWNTERNIAQFDSGDEKQRKWKTKKKNKSAKKKHAKNPHQQQQQQKKNV